jgi:DNA-damage-inducible protein J
MRKKAIPKSLDSVPQCGIFVPIMKTAVAQLRIRVPAARARRVRTILNDLGTDAGSLVNMLFAQVDKRRAIPFSIADTDPETEEIRRDPDAVAAINACREGKIGRWYTTEEVFGE